jgi:S-methylmethionine-dependent homocysteine/selenocysteine methylase
MDVRVFSVLVNGMNQVKAEEHLMLMDALCYPHSDQKQRSKQHKKWSKEAYPESFEQKVLKTTDLELF